MKEDDNEEGGEEEEIKLLKMTDLHSTAQARKIRENEFNYFFPSPMSTF